MLVRFCTETSDQKGENRMNIAEAVALAKLEQGQYEAIMKLNAADVRIAELQRQRDEYEEQADLWLHQAELNAKECERLEQERDAYKEAAIKQSAEIEQILGKALGYPRYVDDQVNFPGATEADGVFVGIDTAETLADQIVARLAAAQVQLRDYAVKNKTVGLLKDETSLKMTAEEGKDETK